MSGHKYDNDVHPHNKFGHTIELLAQHLPAGAEGVHLDLACGFGNVAEIVRDRWGLDYVGVDVDEQSLGALGGRGFETHTADLATEGAYDALVRVLAGRRLASITFLDGLEHLVDGAFALAAIGRLLSEHRAVAVLSVPNVTHYDVAIKNLLGSWTYTEAGLLDRTHYQLYSARSLESALRRAGLARVGSFDVVLNSSDQHFPTDHALLSEATSANMFLRTLRDAAEPHGLTNQFVWAVTATPPAEDVASDAEDNPFLSVIMRTQGRRPQELREAFLCLAGQSSQDFEVIVVAHKTTLEEQKGIERLIEDQPPRLRSRIRLILLDSGPRSKPLNVGVAEARGRYISIHDDDDIVLGDWVQEFARAERNHYGRILRGVTLRQEVDVCTVEGQPGVRAVGAPEAAFTEEFSLAHHLVQNQSPPIGFVFPRSLHTDLGLDFDESMTTTEDWEFLLRAAPIVGVTDINKVLAIYHWWPTRESSRTVHSAAEWKQNGAEIERRVDSRPLLLPAGETRALRQDLLELLELPALRARMDELDLLKETHELTQQHVANLENALSSLKEELAAKQERIARLTTSARQLRKRLKKRRQEVDQLRRGVAKPAGGAGGKKPGALRRRVPGVRPGRKNEATPTESARTP